MKIQIQNRQKDLAIKLPQVRNLVKAFLDLEKISVDEVGIHFVSQKGISLLHEKFFQDPSPTDCISFPVDHTIINVAGTQSLGDVFVCPKTALIYAAHHQIDPYEELTLYIIHGLLHLIGYDDMESRKKRKMRAAEKRHMSNLRSLGLILH